MLLGATIWRSIDVSANANGVNLKLTQLAEARKQTQDQLKEAQTNLARTTLVVQALNAAVANTPLIQSDSNKAIFGVLQKWDGQAKDTKVGVYSSEFHNPKSNTTPWKAMFYNDVGG